MSLNALYIVMCAGFSKYRLKRAGGTGVSFCFALRTSSGISAARVHKVEPSRSDLAGYKCVGVKSSSVGSNTP
jgi:hypothetical protein